MDITETISNHSVLLIQKWVENHFCSGKHIDEIVPKLAVDSWVGATLVALKHLASNIRVDELAVACFPIGYEDKINLTPIEFFELKYGIGDEPPSLHLLTASICLKPEVHEEYRFPVSCPVEFPQGVVSGSYYRCFRSAEDIGNNWEFVRALYIEVSRG